MVQNGSCPARIHHNQQENTSSRACKYNVIQVINHVLVHANTPNILLSVIFQPTVTPCCHQGFKLSTLSGKIHRFMQCHTRGYPMPVCQSCQCVNTPHNQLIMTRAREQPSDVRFQLASRAVSRAAWNPRHSVPETRFTSFLGSPRPTCTCYRADLGLWCCQILCIVL